jgi:hypothetical protein
MLVADNLPELGTDLVAALAALDVEDLPHGWISRLVAAGGRGAEGWLVARKRWRHYSEMGMENQIYGGITSSGTKSLRSGHNKEKVQIKKKWIAENLKTLAVPPQGK